MSDPTISLHASTEDLALGDGAGEGQGRGQGQANRGRKSRQRGKGAGASGPAGPKDPVSPTINLPSGMSQYCFALLRVRFYATSDRWQISKFIPVDPTQFLTWFPALAGDTVDLDDVNFVDCEPSSDFYSDLFSLEDSQNSPQGSRFFASLPSVDLEFDQPIRDDSLNYIPLILDRSSNKRGHVRSGSQTSHSSVASTAAAFPSARTDKKRNKPRPPSPRPKGLDTSNFRPKDPAGSASTTASDAAHAAEVARREKERLAAEERARVQEQQDRQAREAAAARAVAKADAEATAAKAAAPGDSAPPAPAFKPPASAPSKAAADAAAAKPTSQSVPPPPAPPAADPNLKVVVFVSLDRQLGMEPKVYLQFESGHRLGLEKKKFKTEQEFMLAADMNWFRYDSQKKCAIIQAKSVEQMNLLIEHVSTIRVEVDSVFYRFRAWPAATVDKEKAWVRVYTIRPHETPEKYVSDRFAMLHRFDPLLTSDSFIVGLPTKKSS